MKYSDYKINQDFKFIRFMDKFDETTDYGTYVILATNYDSFMKEHQKIVETTKDPREVFRLIHKYNMVPLDIRKIDFT